MSTLRNAQHQIRFTVYELEALKPVLVRLGKDLGTLTRGHIEDLLLLSYSLPSKHRADPDKSVAAIVIAASLLSTVRRHEIQRHMDDSTFIAAVSCALDVAQDEIDRQRVMLSKGRQS
jgi:hypothetical protein